MDSFYVPEEQLMHRFYADPDRSDMSRAFLTKDDAHHALNVLRLRTGDPAEIILDGSRYNACIESVSSGDVSLRLDAPLPSTETRIPVTLFQGIPKGDKMDWIVQKSAELGVRTIVPVEMSRCVVRLDPHDIRKKTERWQKIAREAGKQSGRCVIPQIQSPVKVAEIADSFRGVDKTVVPWEMCEGYGPLAFSRDYPNPSSLGIVIGPEGGISPEEIKLLESLSCIPVTLGPRILRTETAGLAAVSAFSAVYGEME